MRLAWVPLAILFGWVSGHTSPDRSTEAAGDSLASVWESSMRAQPRYAANELRIEAEDAERRALRRDRYPSVEIEGGGDFGQRVRPGEERDEGLAGRGEILARVNWSLLESGRSARQRAVEFRRSGLAAADAAFDLAFRGEVARAYIGASVASERRQLLLAAEPAFEKLAAVVRMRVREGVESTVALDQIEESAAARAARLRAEADAAEGKKLMLALLADRETVQPLRIDPRPPRAAVSVETSPALAALRHEAGERLAEAEALERTDRWRLDAVGQAGPYFSRAFDRTTEHEYFGGLRFVWSPDLAGARSSRALAERRRARALEADEAGLRRDLSMRVREIDATLGDADARTTDWRAAVERAAAAERTARLRWEHGAGSWSDWWEKRERLLEAKLDELDWRRQTAEMLVEYAEASGRIDDLPAWIGQRSGDL